MKVRDAAEIILSGAEALRLENTPLLIAVDGRCASGKTTLAGCIRESCGCNVIHMDHFFLRPEQRTARRLDEPGGNVDYERFFKEVLIPLRNNSTFFYRPYDCHRQELSSAVHIEPRAISVIEGSYCCHPSLFDYYDLRVFLTVDAKEQMRRIKLRNGEEAAKRFQHEWIPMEERYFSAYKTEERANLRFRL